MGTLSTELGTVAGRISGRPRVYADANVPAGLVSFMRTRLGWDVLFVIEHDDLRRAPDGEHYRMARRLRRTLVTLDRDYLDEREFPSAGGPGVLVASAPDEPGLAKLLERVDAVLFRASGPAAGHLPASATASDLPLEGQKLHVHPDWMIPAGGRRRRPR
jgi:hypothetical protein